MRPMLRFAVQTALVAAAAYAAAGALAARRKDEADTVTFLPRPAEREKEDDIPAAVAAEAAGEAARSGPAYVRPAGREAMRDPQRRWDGVDEASDESFPASDPPASY